MNRFIDTPSPVYLIAFVLRLWELAVGDPSAAGDRPAFVQEG